MARWFHSLQAKILILVILMLSLGFGVSMLFTIEVQRRVLKDQMIERAKILASTLYKSIKSNMLEGRPDIARGLIKELKRLEVENPSPEEVIPHPLNRSVPGKVAAAV